MGHTYNCGLRNADRGLRLKIADLAADEIRNQSAIAIRDPQYALLVPFKLASGMPDNSTDLAATFAFQTMEGGPGPKTVVSVTRPSYRDKRNLVPQRLVVACPNHTLSDF
jgi:hypothetical protein